MTTEHIIQATKAVVAAIIKTACEEQLDPWVVCQGINFPTEIRLSLGEALKAMPIHTRTFGVSPRIRDVGFISLRALVDSMVDDGVKLKYHKLDIEFRDDGLTIQARDAKTMNRWTVHLVYDPKVS